MPGPTNLYYRLRIRNASDTADTILVTSVRAGANPYILAPPRGDGATYNPLTGESMFGSYTLLVADWPIGGTPLQRVVTSQLEDVTLKQQLAYRKCYVEMSTTGTTWPMVLLVGYLSLLRLVDAMTYEVTIQDPMRALERITAFAPESNILMREWFSTAHFPYRGCLAGGPIMTPGGANTIGPVGVRDLGGWEMRVEALRSDNVSQFYVLRPRVVYGPPDWIANTRSNLNDFAEQINNAAAAFQAPTWDVRNNSWNQVQHAQTNGYCWSNLTWLIDEHDGNGFVAWKPYPFDQYVIVDPVKQSIKYNQSLVSNFSGNWGIGAMPDGSGTKTLTPGALVRVRAVSIIPTENSPLYLWGNPTDLLAQLFTEYLGPASYDPVALTNIRASIRNLGEAVMTFRITAPMPLTDIIKQITQPLGIGIRGDSQGRLQVFDGRLQNNSNTLPSVQITAADVIDGTTSLPFELDPSRTAQTIKFRQTHLTDQKLAAFNHDAQNVDGVIISTDELLLTNADVSAVRFGALDWTTDGMISTVNAKSLNWQQYIIGQGQSIFDRFGRGGIAFETTLIRGGAGDNLALGDEALINVPQVPNHNYRLGDNPAIAARRMQITRRTILPEGYAVRFDDSGPHLQPLALVPVLTIAASTDSPRTIAEVTITNAAAINSATWGARLQWSVTAPGGTPTGLWTDVTAWIRSNVTTLPIRLPPVVAGSTISVRARTEAVPNLPSNWSVPVSITLTTIPAPSGLTITPNASDASLATMRWTIGASAGADLIDVWLRLAALASAKATRVHVLNPGSTQYVLEGLGSATNYIAGVQHRDPRTGDVSAITEVTFTTATSVRTLSAPVNPASFAGMLDPLTGAPNRDGTFGIGVLAAEFPGFLEVQIAVETAIGSNAYGAFETRTSAPAIASVLGDWTKAFFVAPNDGLRRLLQARHVLDGCTPSLYCTPVSVLPWTPKALPPLPANLIIVEVTGLPPSPPSDAGIYWRFMVNAIDSGGQPTQVAVTSVSGNGVAIVSGPALGVYAPNDTVWKVSLPPTGTGPGSITCQGLSADGRRGSVSLTLPEVASGNDLLIPPGIQESTSETPVGSNPMTGTLTITVTDPDLRVTQIRFRTQAGNGAWSGYTTFASAPASISVALVEGHISKIEYEVWANMGGGSVLYFRSIVPFNTGSIPTAPVLEATYDGSGNLTVALTGDSDTQSSRLGASLVSISAANALAQAAAPVNGRIAIYNNVLLAVGSGVRAYIVAYAYPQANGGGVASVAAQITKDREGPGTQTPTGVIHKRQRMNAVNFYPASFIEGGTSLEYLKDPAGGLSSWDMNHSFAKEFLTAIQLPPGVTITVFRARLGSTNAQSTANAYLFRPDGNGGATTIASLFAVAGSGTNVYAQALSEGPTGSESYTAGTILQGPLGTNQTAFIGWFEIEYDMPTYDKTI